MLLFSGCAKLPKFRTGNILVEARCFRQNWSSKHKPSLFPTWTTTAKTHYVSTYGGCGISLGSNIAPLLVNDGSSNGYHHHMYESCILLGTLASAMVMATSSQCDLAEFWMKTPKTQCEKPTSNDEHNGVDVTSLHITPPNPLWPSGVDSKQVDVLVEDCLKDPTINIESIPDYLERQLYKATIQLTLNLIYHVLGKLHGTSVLAHELQIERISIPPSSTGGEHELHLSQLRNDLDEKVLEEIADRLLANKAVNQTLIPDVLERQLYVSCLKIVFRLLDLLSATLAVTVCGHDFRLSIEPTQRKQLLTQQAQKVLSSTTATASPKQANSNTATKNDDNKPNNEQQKQIARSKICTPIDTELLLDYASYQAGIDVNESELQRSWFSKWFQPNFSQQFMVQLHASLYGLILGLLDDLLDHTTLNLLNDQVQLDLVAVPESVRIQRQKQNSNNAGASEEGEIVKAQKESGNGYLPFASFTMGVGVGLCLMTLVKDYKRFM